MKKLTLRLPDSGSFGFGGKGGVMRLFRMTPTHVEVPRNWPHARDLMRNVPVVDRRSSGHPTNLKFNGQFREGQRDYVDQLLDGLEDDGYGGIGCAGCGFGKCLARGTLCLMADGRTLPVEAIVAGDRLMGPDGKARTVLRTNTGRGPMYQINPIKGESWGCNDVHVLTLVNYRTGEIRDMQLDQWQSLTPSAQERWKQFSAGVDEFEHDPSLRPLDVDPYFLGVWFGDGTKTLRTLADGSCVLSRVAVSKPDPEILEACEENARAWGLRIRTDGTTCPTHHLVSMEGSPNALLDTMRALVGPGIAVPASVLRGSREARLQFLAGFLDADGEHVQTCFTVAQKREDWARAIWFIARSLGFMATIRPRQARDQNGTEGTYFVVVISGETTQIPVRLPRRKAAVRTQRKVATRTGFSTEALGEGDYFGFTLDGDGRFLLGDFTVTHNTVTMLPVLAAINRTTLILVHKEALLNQWIKACREFLGVDPGVVQADRFEYEGKQIVVAMVQTLAARDFPTDFYNYFGVVVTDEVHRVAAPTWVDAVSRFSAKLRIGTTATPRRGDKMEDVFFWHMGEVLAEGRGKFLDCVVTRVHFNPRLAPESYTFRGRPNLGKLITKLARHESRTAMAVRIMAKAARAGRRVMVLSDRVEHLEDMKKRVEIMFLGAGELHTAGIFGQGSTKKAKAERDAATLSSILLATWPMASEGLDLPCFDTLIMATPKADVEQGSGRIRRLFEGKKQPHIVDIVDDVPFIHRISGKRLKYYTRKDMNKNSWPVQDVE